MEDCSQGGDGGICPKSALRRRMKDRFRRQNRKSLDQTVESIEGLGEYGNLCQPSV